MRHKQVNAALTRSHGSTILLEGGSVAWLQYGASGAEALVCLQLSGSEAPSVAAGAAAAEPSCAASAERSMLLPAA